MKTKACEIFLLALMVLASDSKGAIHYVDINSTNATAPYSDWSTAATNIQDAIDSAIDGDTVLVTNGVYTGGGKVMAGDLTNRIALDKAVTVQSVNGPFVTTIQGAGAANGTNAVRCAWLTNNAALIGFTVTAGATRTSGNNVALESGGGVWCASSNAAVVNCLIVSNAAYYRGSGIFQGTVRNSYVSHNNSGGGISSGPIFGANVSSCTIVSNTALASAAVVACNLTNCIVYLNQFGNWTSSTFTYCCVTPLFSGEGSFTNAPQLFIDGIHLTSSSPCIGSGTNITSGTDIFGNAWSNPPSVGCAEWQAMPNVVAKPQIQLTSRPVGFTIGNALVAGQSPFSYFWLKDGLLLQDDDHFTSTQTSNLVTLGIRFSDVGSYQLVVSNSFGVATSAVAQLIFHCVDAANSYPLAPFSTWATAATNIQDAIDSAAAGEIVLVTNGIYSTGGKVMAGDLTNRVALDKALTVISVNGYSDTVIEGMWDPISTNGTGAVRCAFLADGAVLNGFTLRSGATRGGNLLTYDLQYGGGARCISTNGMILNCVLTNNAARGGGSAVISGTVNNSLLNANIIDGVGIDSGAACFSTLNNCTVVNNKVVNFGGVAGTYNGTTRNSIVVNNYYYNSFGFPSSLANWSGGGYAFSCTSPSHSGTGNISSTPLFLDELYHLPAASPCRATGSSLYASGTDLDGETWTNPPSMGWDEVIDSNLVGPLVITALRAFPTNSGLVNTYFSFAGYTTGRVSRLDWSFDDGTILTNYSYSTFHQWTNAGNFLVTFTAYNNDYTNGVSTNLLVVIKPVIVKPSLEFPAATSNGFQFAFTSQVNVNYSIDYATNLVPPIIWQNLQMISGTGDSIQITDPVLNDSSRFYRVSAQ